LATRVLSWSEISGSCCSSFSINWLFAEANATPAPTIVDDDSFEKELCKAKEAGEWFRLQAGEGDNCRDVIQCTSSVRDLDWPFLFLFLFLFQFQLRQIGLNGLNVLC
jgi:hypothetical protein